jgi:hypothetical protein
MTPESYPKSLSPSTVRGLKKRETVRRIMNGARASARASLQSREREIKVFPTWVEDGRGWDAWEFTEGGGMPLAENVSWHEAMRAAVSFLNQAIEGLQPTFEIRLGH